MNETIKAGLQHEGEDTSQEFEFGTRLQDSWYQILEGGITALVLIAGFVQRLQKALTIGEGIWRVSLSSLAL